MIEHQVTQGTAAWYALRLGLPTSSRFDEIITPAKGEFSKASRKYAFYLVAETVLRQPLESIDNLEWVARGTAMEPAAVKQYEFVQEVEVREVGFITNDDGTAGCSPDRLLVGQRGGLECKCPAPQTHIGYLIDGPGQAYKPQIMGQMLIAELDFVDFYSWHPAMPPVLTRTHRDEDYIQKVSAALRQFNDMKDAMLAKARSSGFFEALASPVTPADLAYDDARYRAPSDADVQAMLDGPI